MTVSAPQHFRVPTADDQWKFFRLLALWFRRRPTRPNYRPCTPRPEPNRARNRQVSIGTAEGDEATPQRSLTTCRRPSTFKAGGIRLLASQDVLRLVRMRAERELQQLQYWPSSEVAEHSGAVGLSSCFEETRLPGYRQFYRVGHIPIDNVVLSSPAFAGLKTFTERWSRIADCSNPRFSTFCSSALPKVCAASGRVLGVAR